MLTFSFDDAATNPEQATSSIWRTIRAGRAAAGRTDFAGFLIDSDASVRDPLARVAGDPTDDMTEQQAELLALQAMVRDLRLSRDAWRARAERASAAVADAALAVFGRCGRG